MEHYDLIWSEEEAIKFFKKLSPLKENECYTVGLFARKKYASEEDQGYLKLNISDSCYDRKVIKFNNPDSFINTIRRYCVPVGSYVCRDGNPLPFHILSLYMDTNPRSARMATQHLVKKIMDGVFAKTFDFTKTDSEFKNLLQSNRSRAIYADLDIDTTDKDVLEEMLDFLNENLQYSVKSVVQTRGGFHVLIDMAAAGIANKQWHPLITDYIHNHPIVVEKETAMELNTKRMCPIPGTMQGGSKVKLLL